MTPGMVSELLHIFPKISLNNLNTQWDNEIITGIGGIVIVSNRMNEVLNYEFLSAGGAGGA